MRRLILVRGPHAAGKSSFLRQVGLDEYALSADALRTMFGAPLMSRTGEIIRNQDQEPRVWHLLEDLLQQRMERGETVAVDATHARTRALEGYAQQARRHRYRVVLVDFAEVPWELLVRRNDARPLGQRVPEHILERSQELCRAQSVPPGIDVIPWAPDGSHVDALRAWLHVPVEELSAYDRVVHVGDVQGCLTPLVAPDGPFPAGLDDGTYYVFVGDLCDRGIENGALVRWILDEILDRPNVALVWGNHERHLHRWSLGRVAVSPEFERRTLPQLEQAGIRPEDVDRLCDALHDVFFYRWRDQPVMVTHAGLATVPERPELISLSQYTHGTGFYEDPVDEQFSRYAPSGWVQVHGHRNSSHLPIRASERSFNLEGQVEVGGALRWLVLDDEGFHPRETRNRTFRTLRDRFKIGDRRRKAQEIVPAWIRRDGDDGVTLDPHVLTQLLAHPEVRVKEDRPRETVLIDVGMDAWRDVDVAHRPKRSALLLIRPESGEVLARSADRALELGGRLDADMRRFERKLRFPVTGYVDEPGRRCWVGYDTLPDDLVATSASGVEAAATGRFMAALDLRLEPGHREVLRRWLRDAEATLAFAFHDGDDAWAPAERPRLVLVDVVRRAMVGDRLSYDELRRVANRFQLEPKEPALRFQEWKTFAGWLRTVMGDDGYEWQGRVVPGFIIEDSRGARLRLPLASYDAWQTLRTHHAREVESRRTGVRSPGPEDTFGARFAEWLEAQPDDVLTLDLRELRRRFEGSGPEDGNVVPFSGRWARERGDDRSGGSGAGGP